MADRLDLILRRLREEGTKTATFFAALTPGQWATRVYDDGPGFTAHDLLAHLGSTERQILALVRSVCAGGPGAPIGFDVDAFNAREVADLRDQPSTVLLAVFSDARKRTVDFVAALHEDDLDRIGQHPYLGQAPVADMLKLLYRHTMLHERDIRARIHPTL
jgi:hypothetical protein